VRSSDYGGTLHYLGRGVDNFSVGSVTCGVPGLGGCAHHDLEILTLAASWEYSVLILETAILILIRIHADEYIVPCFDFDFFSSRCGAGVLQRKFCLGFWSSAEVALAGSDCGASYRCCTAIPLVICSGLAE
jgi:hypothetical protein